MEKNEKADSSAQTWRNMQAADWYFRKAARKFVKERDKINVGGVTLPGMLILHRIERDGACRLGDLAEEMDFTSGAITGICDKLEKFGFATRTRPEDDRRTVLLTITPKGREMTARNREVGVRCISALFAGLGDEELAALVSILPKMIENLDTFSQQVSKAIGKCAKESTFPDGDYLGY